MRNLTLATMLKSEFARRRGRDSERRTSPAELASVQDDLANTVGTHQLLIDGLKAEHERQFAKLRAIETPGVIEAEIAAAAEVIQRTRPQLTREGAIVLALQQDEDLYTRYCAASARQQELEMSGVSSESTR